MEKTGVSNKTLTMVCGGMNYWMATWYLKLFGRVELPAVDADVFMDRIKHDFAFRAINFSSLEMMYASIFRATPGRGGED